MLATTDWHGGFGLPPNLARGVVAVSGVYDLEPIRLSHVNDWLRLDRDGAHRNSPVRHIAKAGCPLVVAWSERDTREFIRQSTEFGRAWMDAGFDCRLIAEPGENHFSVINLLGRPGSSLGDAAMAQMGLPTP
jgi:arylformamidase